MKVTVEQIAPERAEEVLLRCHDPKEPWVEEILAAKIMWHLIDFGQSFYMAAALNEQIRKRKREEIQKEGTNNG